MSFIKIYLKNGEIIKAGPNDWYDIVNCSDSFYHIETIDCRRILINKSEVIKIESELDNEAREIAQQKHNKWLSEILPG